MIAVAERRQGERRQGSRAIPTHATEREYAVLRALDALIDPDAPNDMSYDAGFAAGLRVARDSMLVLLAGQR